MLHVVFTAPQHFDRTANSFGYLNSLRDEIEFDTTTETTTQIGSTYGDVLWLDAQYSSCRTLRTLLELSWASQITFIAFNISDHVHWLERLVSHHGCGVVSLNDFSCTSDSTGCITHIRTNLDSFDIFLSAFDSSPHTSR